MHVRIEGVVTHLGGDPGQADVQRVCQAAGHILVTPGAVVPVVDGNTADDDGAGIKENGTGRDSAVIQGGRHGKDLGNGTGFVCLADGPVKGCFAGEDLAHLGVVIQVHARGGRHGQDFTGFGIHDDDGSGCGAGAYQGVIQDFFHRGLDFAVDRQDEGLAWLDLGIFHRLAWVGRDEHGYRYASQDVVIFFFHSHVAVIVLRHIADYGGSQVVFRVAAHQVRCEMHGIQVGAARIGLVVLL